VDEETRQGMDYPQDIDRSCRGESQGSEHIVAWVSHCFEVVNKRPRLPSWIFPGGGRSPAPQVRIGDDLFSDLVPAYSLMAWIYAASRDPGIEQLYGRSERYIDIPCWLLMGEAFDFLNDMLLRHHTAGLLPSMNEEIVRREEKLLWEGLSAGIETYEVGALVYYLAARSDSDVIEMGSNSELRRVEGPWAAERFEKALEIPHNRWAITVRVNRPYRPGPTTIPRSFRRDPSEMEFSEYLNDGQFKEVLEQGELALRLIRPHLIYQPRLPNSCSRPSGRLQVVRALGKFVECRM
jgi:hypothetical protein